MTLAFNRDALLDAFDRIGVAAVAAGARLQIAVYGGSALMLASNFRFATEDVDIADIGHDWPKWLTAVVAEIAADKGWSAEWLNDAVSFHLSPLAQQERDHFAFGTFPRSSDHTGLSVLIPSARYLLAMKLKSLRISNFEKGALDMQDTANPSSGHRNHRRRTRRRGAQRVLPQKCGRCRQAKIRVKTPAVSGPDEPCAQIPWRKRR